ncbi:MAG: 3-isopropylmalate/(R)-2-methylmalate dehydratase small subunit [Candidatus Tokpelaia sp. JSC161]|jgi:3-isopropylmalate/(R)-2-methylmalate dehydratase small subunit|nr:MAG: 3-isopropylmalate/(R)-2-methylmalate dehydratase small subunit [Candidatus Tokpelaia sp. JSC161]
MEKFIKITGIAVSFPILNIDTDMIIPKDYLKTVKRTGLAQGLFAGMRYNNDGSENQECVLNTARGRCAKILLVGDNFGCGSSREHAQWALFEFGIRCLISTSFAEIFYNNCFKNSILPVRVSLENLRKLMDDASCDANAILEVDLEKMEISRNNCDLIAFEVDNFHRYCLLNGLDDISLTMEKSSHITCFEKRTAKIYPWI